MNDYKNFCEYSYIPERGTKRKILMVALVCLYTIFTFLYLLVFWVFLRALALLLLLPFILLALVRITQKYVNTEYEILVEAGEMTVAVIYGDTKRRTKKNIYLPEATLIGRYDANRAVMLKNGKFDEILDFSQSPQSENSFVCVYPDRKRGKKQAIIFDTNEELRRVLRICNPSAFVRDTHLE